MQWAQAESPQEAERQHAQEMATVDRLAHEFRLGNVDLAEYLGLPKADILDPNKVRQAVRQKRVTINQMDSSQQGEEHQRLTEVSKVLLTESARAVYLQEGPNGFFGPSGFASYSGFGYIFMPRPPTEQQLDFFDRVEKASTSRPGIINDLIREWEASAFSFDQYRAHAEAGYNPALVRPQEVGSMICLLTAKLCSGGITNGPREDPRTIFYEAIHARLCFFEQLFQSKLTDDDQLSSFDGMACKQFRTHADRMVRTIFQAHEQGLQPAPDVEGLSPTAIPNPSDKVGRFIMIKRVSELCGWAGAQTAQNGLRELCKEHEATLRCTTEEEFDVKSKYFIRSF
jgi:hypothetical protein